VGYSHAISVLTERATCWRQQRATSPGLREQVAGLPKGITNMPGFLALLTAKLAGLGAVTKATLAAATAAVTMTMAGAPPGSSRFPEAMPTPVRPPGVPSTR